MRNKVAYYMSIAIVSFILLIFLLTQVSAKREVEKKKREFQIYQKSAAKRVKIHPGLIPQGKDIFDASQKEYLYNPNKTYFAYSDTTEEYNTCISVKENYYIIFQIRKNKLTVYSKGTISIDSSSNTNVYTFKSHSMRSIEAYYRSKEIAFSGAFFHRRNNHLIENWEENSIDDTVYESWKLVEEDGYLRDSFSNMLFIF